MASSLFGNQKNQAPQNNIFGMIQQFNQFKQQIAGQDPQAIVHGMLKSGQMSQQQFDELAKMATQLQNVLK